MDRSQNWPNEVQRLLEIIRKTGLEETIKWGEKSFTYKGRNVVGCIGFKNHFVLWFYNGVFLSDPYKVLQNAQEGKTKAMRQWRFQSADEIDEVKILEYIHEAIQNEEEGKVWKPEKSTEMEVPALFQEKLEMDPIDLRILNEPSEKVPGKPEKRSAVRSAFSNPGVSRRKPVG